MSGVWVFDNGVIRLVEKPGAAASVEGTGRQGSSARGKVLVYTTTNEVITSYELLENKLSSLGWERYKKDSQLLQFHKPPSVDLISLPKDFNKLKPRHMYDIVVKNRNVFEVRDM